MLYNLICINEHEMLVNVEIYKTKRKSPLDHFLGTFFWVPNVLDCYYFGSGCDTVICYFA